MIQLDSQLRIQIGDLAVAQAGLYRRGEDLLAGNLKQVEWGKAAVAGTFSLPSGAMLRLELTLEPLGPAAVAVKVGVTNTGGVPFDFDRFDAPGIALAPGFARQPVWTMQGAFDYVNERELGVVNGAYARLDADFKGALLLAAILV